ncbi:MAG: AAA family ATPase [Anaerolineales bacterium]|nr:AAA family ATPase [Anaerolineales bacterium]
MATRKLERRLLLKNLGFLEDPFMASADPRFLYLSTQHGDVLERTRDIIEEFRGLAVVEGGYGVGKSSLALRLEFIYRGMPDGYTAVYVHTAGYESEFAGLQDISDAVAIPRKRGLTKQWRELESFLVDEHEKGKNVVIILDDAQLMAADSLRIIHTLYNFDTRGRKMAQVILFGQPELSYKFAIYPEIRSRINSWFRLNPLSIEESVELIRFRCRVAGRDDPLMTQAGFLEIFESTGGTPREIVNLCARLIDEMGVRDLKTADIDAVQKTIDDYKDVHSSRTAQEEAISAEQET